MGCAGGLGRAEALTRFRRSKRRTQWDNCLMERVQNDGLHRFSYFDLWICLILCSQQTCCGFGLGQCVCQG